MPKVVSVGGKTIRNNDDNSDDDNDPDKGKKRGKKPGDNATPAVGKEKPKRGRPKKKVSPNEDSNKSDNQETTPKASAKHKDKTKSTNTARQKKCGEKGTKNGYKGCKNGAKGRNVVDIDDDSDEEEPMDHETGRDNVNTENANDDVVHMEVENNDDGKQCDDDDNEDEDDDEEEDEEDEGDDNIISHSKTGKKKNRKYDFTEAQEQTLAEMFARYPSLYQQDHPDHKNTVKKQAIYEKVASKVSSDGKFFSIDLLKL